MEPLTPLRFLACAADLHPRRTAIVHGAIRRTWAETYARCRRLASALARAGVAAGDVVAVVAANGPELYEAHFGVPMAGAVLCALNTRLDAATIAHILGHSRARVLLTDREYSRAVAAALARLDDRPLVIDLVDGEGGELLGATDYEAFLAGGDPAFAWLAPADEWAPIALNYTSGTTGQPKGVVYHHRGAYLAALANALSWPLGERPVYLWTLPMFHCNGWCFPWTLALVAGTNVCLRAVRAEPIHALIESEKVTHLCGAPPVLATIASARRSPAWPVKLLTGGAAPPAALIEELERLGFEVTHGYGLTETFGVATIGSPAWTDPRLKARQGLPMPLLDELMVADPDTQQPVARDGAAIGEVFLRGSTIMSGYFREEPFAGGWLRTGDLAVWHEDGSIELKDRSKDIIISGGENISSLEVEAVLYRHPAVLEAAVVARPDPRWGESPCAFVSLRPDTDVDERDLVSFCRQHLAHYKVPKSIVYGPLPRTETGKIRKDLLRERAAALALLV